MPEHPDNALVYLFVKEPVPGRVKTRLSPPLSPAQAAACYRAFLEDMCERLARAAAVELRLAVAERPSPFVEALAGQFGFALCEQGPGDLGRRMRRVMEAGGPQRRPVILLGSDLPDLPVELVEEAASALRTAATVVGPGLDGGYYLLGARGRVPPVFELDAHWGGPTVLARTLEGLERAGLEPHLLPSWEDVDDHQGLCRLAARLAGQDSSPHTRACLDLLGGQGLLA